MIRRPPRSKRTDPLFPYPTPFSDLLYGPVAQLHLVSRYSGASPETAPLHSLGGEQWTKARRKAAEKVRDVAAELLDIQAKRQARAGLAIDVDRAMYEPFAATFPFEETPDQHSAIEAVIRRSEEHTSEVQSLMRSAYAAVRLTQIRTSYAPHRLYKAR